MVKFDHLVPFTTWCLNKLSYCWVYLYTRITSCFKILFDIISTKQTVPLKGQMSKSEYHCALTLRGNHPLSWHLSGTKLAAFEYDVSLLEINATSQQRVSVLPFVPIGATQGKEYCYIVREGKYSGHNIYCRILGAGCISISVWRRGEGDLFL